jgi:hypothetical protein
MLEKRFKPTDQDREVVKLLSGFGLPLERIAKAVRNPLTRRGIGVNTLQARFEHEPIAIPGPPIEASSIACPKWVTPIQVHAQGFTVPEIMRVLAQVVPVKWAFPNPLPAQLSQQGTL